LAHIGVALLIIIGVKGILDHLVNKTDSTQPDGVKGYSSGAYGR
jgi:putative Mn2+ efflux pump MntP